jgi:hypothetical protein
MRKTIQKLVAVFLLISAMSLAVFPQTRIRIAKGRSSATVTGFLGAEERKSYVVGARRGQKMTLTLRAFGGTVIVTDSDGNSVEMPESKQTMNYIFSETGDVTVTVYKQGGGSTEYSLKVAIR